MILEILWLLFLLTLALLPLVLKLEESSEVLVVRLG